LCTTAVAVPSAAPGYTLDVVSQTGAIFCGLAEEPGALLVTNLADGRLYRRDDSTGRLVPFGPALPHGIDVIGDPTGPYRVAVQGDGYLIAQGWTPVDADEAPRDHALLTLDPSGEAAVLSDDFWNPFAFVAVGEAIFVVDAARNTVERLGVDGGRRTVAAFPRLEQEGEAMQSLSPTEFTAAEIYQVDAVPTGIAARDGRLFVSLFGGFPFIAGGGVVVSFDPANGPDEQRVEVGDLDSPVGVAFAPDGSLLVLEHGEYDQANGFLPGTGRLLSVAAAGERATLIDGLTRPASVLVRDDGTIAVSSLDGTLVFLTKGSADQGQ
jgi:DNA-binding beta-propeller fold protein YncE